MSESRTTSRPRRRAGPSRRAAMSARRRCPWAGPARAGGRHGQRRPDQSGLVHPAAPRWPTAAARADPKGFFTDTSVCIGCKACEVACKQWNAPAERRLRVHRLQLRQHRLALGHDLAPRRLRRAAGRGARGRAVQLAHVVGRVQALHARRLPASLPDRRDHPHRVRHGGRAGRCLQRLWLLRARLPLRRGGTGEQPLRRPSHSAADSIRQDVDGMLAQKCTLCYDRLVDGMEAGLRQSLPDRLDPVRRPRRAARRAPQSAWTTSTRAASREAYLYGAQEGDPGSTREHRPAQRLLPAARQAGSLQPAGQAATAAKQRRCPATSPPGSPPSSWASARRSRSAVSEAGLPGKRAERRILR